MIWNKLRMTVKSSFPPCHADANSPADCLSILEFYRFLQLFGGKFSMFLPDMIPTVPGAHDQM